jgi:uncharacterized protein
MAAPFLRAEWRHVAILNYGVDRAALAGLVPRGTELDEWKGRTYLSVVGFLFRNTRVLGLPIPFHRNFEEVNLRFYVRRRTADGWRRAVVFVKEIVPRAAVAVVARALYNENYVALPMGHEIGRAAHPPERIESVSYSWREYRVDHPPWRVAPASRAGLDGDVGPLYGDRFVEFLRAPPASAFMAEGSEVAVYRGARLAG